MHAKHEPKHPSPAKSSAIPGPPSIACSVYSSHIEIRLGLTVHATLLNLRFHLMVKAHDDGEDVVVSVRMKEWGQHTFVEGGRKIEGRRVQISGGR